jgi:hypothetical protein
VTATLSQRINDVTYIFTPKDKLLGALSAVRQRLFPRRVLVAGPFVGEFGHELMEWQGVIRARVPHYQAVHVIVYPGRDYLYPGCLVHHHQVRLENAGYGLGRFSPRELREMAQATARGLGLRNYDVLTPQHACTRYHRDYIWRQKLVLLQEPPAGGRLRDLAFHFRRVDKEGPDKLKNYPSDMADRLIESCLTDGYRVCCIGHPEYAYCPPAAEDLRALDLRETVAAISSVKMVVGEISGPMQLASLCGKPTVNWAAGQWRIDYSLRWNHFGTPIFVAANDTHRPVPERIKQTIDGAMRQLHLRGS